MCVCVRVCVGGGGGGGGGAQVSGRSKYLPLLIDEARRRRGARAGAGVAVCAVPRALAARGGGAWLLRALWLWLSVS